MMNPSSIQSPTLIRRARSADAETLLGLIDALAAYEKLTPPDPWARNRLTNDIFGDQPKLEAFLAEHDGKAVGYSLIFETYSSFLGLPTLFLEDIFILPEYRGKKVGYVLFKAMVAEAHRRGCGRMEWTVLDWNRLAIDFYNRLGAQQLNDWQLFRLTHEGMERLLRDHP